MNFLCDYLDLLSIMADFKEAAIRAFAHAAGETVISMQCEEAEEDVDGFEP
jgi:hypothetical protein